MKFTILRLMTVFFTVAAASVAAEPPAPVSEADATFFENSVLPILRRHCYECHSHEGKIKGGLALDSRSGWSKGGDSGPAVIPGMPEESILLSAVSYEDDALRMPPKGKLTTDEIDTLDQWVRRGALDPRTTTAEGLWERTYRGRLDWWSLKTVEKPQVPVVDDDTWSRNEVDRFLMAAMRTKHLRPAVEADRRTLARRLAFVLTGLPLDRERVERFVADERPDAYESLVAELLASPHFGERWARHWMDVVHYSDTHGYEWDAPAKNAWAYRDYLVRAFNRDVPFDRLVAEQIAGDLIEPRIDPATGLNESIIGPMSMRLGERRHGDNAQVEGVTQEAMANIIDTTSKAFLATTVACAQCHDHKLDAVEQKDYYALTGVLMSSRWGVRQADAVDPNTAVIEELKSIKDSLREELGKVWLASRSELVSKLESVKLEEKPGLFPESLAGYLSRPEGSMISPKSFHEEHDRRVSAEASDLKLVADFTGESVAEGWSWEGFGMKTGLARDGDFIVADEGEKAIAAVLPAGRWSHLYSQRLGGVLRGPMIEPGKVTNLSVGFAGGRKASQAFILDHCFHSERMAFPDVARPGWLTLTAGNFDRLSGPADTMPRRVYLELATKAYNNYFPPRTGYGGVTAADEADPRSWFGVTRIYEHPAGQKPQDRLDRFVPLFPDTIGADRQPSRKEFAEKAADAILAAIGRWVSGSCDAEDAKLIDEAINSDWLPNRLEMKLEIANLVARYRHTEKRLIPDRTIGSAEDRQEGHDEPLGLRGSYTEFGERVPRGNVRFLRESDGSTLSSGSLASGRAELARSFADPRNPLTARVFVNRVWLNTFGEGLVRTPDDFGHLGEPPALPELLDHLATRFVEEGWSLKRLLHHLVTSAAFRQSSLTDPAAIVADPENRLWHHYPQRRLDAESIRDAMLAVSGRLDPALGGAPIEPYRTAEDPAKRLFRGPLDGLGRRSIYQKMTLMEPPRFLALFNQPLPKLTTGKRDRTNVPDQALALLNDPFVAAMAGHWAERAILDGESDPGKRAARMFETATGRPPNDTESLRLASLVRRSAALRGISPESAMTAPIVWQDVAHALFNLKEFLYVR